ncbi:MAG: radical SAM protein [Bdellovibrionales bacterium]|nr:radical SAM protein [Bdellovibrionales bacterium]
MYFPNYHWHLEISSKCTLKCPRCPRTEQKGSYVVSEISLEQLIETFSQDLFLNEAQKITLCGGQGDPIYHSQFLEVVRFFKSLRPRKIVTIVTNGSHKKRDWWQELAAILDYGDDITFSVDGYDASSNQRYRVNSDWSSTIEAIKTMSTSRAQVIWNTIFFKFNQEHIQEIKNLALRTGADAFRLTRSHLFASFDKPYYLNEQGIDPLEPDSQYLPEALRVAKKMEWFNPQSEKNLKASERYREFHISRKKAVEQTLERYEDSLMFPNCQFGYRGNYVDVEGQFYPCSWVSHPAPEEETPSFLKAFYRAHRVKFNVLKNPLHQVLSDPLWEEVLKQWDSPHHLPEIRECHRKCQKQFFDSEEIRHYLSLGNKSQESRIDRLRNIADLEVSEGKVSLRYCGKFKNTQSLWEWKNWAFPEDKLTIYLPFRKRELTYADVEQNMYLTFLWSTHQLAREAQLTGKFKVEVRFEKEGAEK